MAEKSRVLIAGIGGASLGIEILKCLLLANERYAVYGCDISPLAYGHYQAGFERTFVVDRRLYVDSVLQACSKASIQCIIPGAEEPMVLLSRAQEKLADAKVVLIGNSTSVVSRCSDKGISFESLASRGYKTPLTLDVNKDEDLGVMPFPCVVKPATGTGGSSFVFLARDREEALFYVDYLTRNNKKVIVQEYIPVDEGEFTVGVLSLPDGNLFGSVALRREFHCKLSVRTRGVAGLISSGYSQGLIGEFPRVRKVAEEIAQALDSTGPLNIQGRVKDGTFVPFEINPRFSASTYLRAMAGFNEVDVYLQFVLNGIRSNPPVLKPGYYLRSLSELYVPQDKVP